MKKTDSQEIHSENARFYYDNYDFTLQMPVHTACTIHDTMNACYTCKKVCSIQIPVS